MRLLPAQAGSAAIDAAVRTAYEWARQGQLDRAEALCTEVLDECTDHAGAQLLRAIIEMQTGRPAAAAVSARRAITADPRPATYALLGDALLALDQPQEALDSYDAALRGDAGVAAAHCGRADALMKLHRPRDALDSYEQFLKLRPRDTAALNNRGSAQLMLGDPAAALASFESALALDPRFAEAHRGRGDALRALKRFTAAIECYDAALRIEPDHAGAHFHRGTAYLQWDREPEEALSSYARALQLNPSFEYAPGALYFGLQNRADWSASAPAATAPTAAPRELLRGVLAGQRVIAPFPFLSVSDSAAAQLECAKTYAAFRCGPPQCGSAASVAMTAEAADLRAAGGMTESGAFIGGNRAPRDRLRVAYVSADFREHAMSYLMAGVFEHHDRSRVEPLAISLAPAEATPMGQRVQRAFDGFFDVGARTDQEITDFMRGLKIDIAVDLTGYTDGFRPQIFARRCAPIQINYLGFPGTMGAGFMDYLIADDFVIPPPNLAHYHEHVVYLPDCFQANDARRAIDGRRWVRAEVGLPPDAFVFCCFNNTYKINAPMFDLWMRLLDRTPGSVLWLLGHHAAVRDNLRREATVRGIDPERLVFAVRRPYAEYLRVLGLADLYLDTLPFNAGTTASDALWAGLPLLTCAGEAFAARMAGSLLRTVGLPELITYTMEEYERRAVELATQPPLLRELRSRLAERRATTPLFATERFCRHLESAYVAVWGRHERGEAPSALRVP